MTVAAPLAPAHGALPLADKRLTAKIWCESLCMLAILIRTGAGLLTHALHVQVHGQAAGRPRAFGAVASCDALLLASALQGLTCGSA